MKHASPFIVATLSFFLLIESIKRLHLEVWWFIFHGCLAETFLVRQEAKKIQLVFLRETILVVCSEESYFLRFPLIDTSVVEFSSFAFGINRLIIVTRYFFFHLQYLGGIFSDVTVCFLYFIIHMFVLKIYHARIFLNNVEIKFLKMSNFLWLEAFSPLSKIIC